MERNLRSRKKLCSKRNDPTAEEQLTNKNPTSEILNDDCLLHVFEYLSICDRIRLERVSKRWCAISRMSWKTFSVLNFTSNLWGQHAMINRKALKDVLTLCGESLKVWDMSKISVNFTEKIYVQTLLKFCPNLISIDLTSVKTGVTLISSLVNNCKNIAILNLGKITISIPDWFRDGTILSTFTNLQVLNIESVNESYWPIADVSFSGDWMKFQNKNAVRELCLDYCMGLEKSNIFTAIPQLPNLHTLSLRGSLEDWSAPWDINLIIRANIKTLDISSNLCVNDDFLWKISCVCKYLTSLSISGNTQVSDIGLSAAISASNLEFLNVDEMNIEGSSLSDLPFLRKLSCRYCERLYYKHFEYLFNNSERLESINLKGVGCLYGFIEAAKKSIQSRMHDVPLVMFVDNKVSRNFADMPDNLKVIQAKDDED